MRLGSSRYAWCAGVVIATAITTATYAAGVLPDNDVLMRALADELERSKELALDDLPSPYFIQYTVDDRIGHTIGAMDGGLVHSEATRSRSLMCRVRVGSSQLDNTNFGGPYGGWGGNLPIDDDYTALRHAIWRVTDTDYKYAVELLARKEAYLKEKTVEDRPDDFSTAPPVTLVEPSAKLAFDEDEWAVNIIRLSARFAEYPDIQYSYVSFFAGAVNNYVVNTEGTRLRTADQGLTIDIYAATQAGDGMPLDDNLSFIAEDLSELPSIDKMLADIDELCRKLTARRNAPTLEQYTGPVLFEPVASGMVFAALLGEGICARPAPLGDGGRWGGGDSSFEKKIGLRILPRSFQMHDDPAARMFDETVLVGEYKYDDEAVKPRRVEIVANGILKNQVAGRSPTKKVKQTTGHGKRGGYGPIRSAVGCLYISDDNGMAAEAVKKTLLDAARDEGLEFALRIESLNQGWAGMLGDPVNVYRVFVEDGREEAIRGLQFLPVEARALKQIIAAGVQRKVYNATSSSQSSYIAPAIVFEELELTKPEQQWDKLPILKSPATRAAKQ